MALICSLQLPWQVLEIEQKLKKKILSSLLGNRWTFSFMHTFKCFVLNSLFGFENASNLSKEKGPSSDIYFKIKVELRFFIYLLLCQVT